MISPGKLKLSKRHISRAREARVAPYLSGRPWATSAVSVVFSLVKTAAIAVPFSLAIIAASTIYATWGSLVIVPIQIVGDYKNDIDLGAQISARLANSISEFSMILDEQQSTTLSRSNPYDILETYVLNMPHVDLRKPKNYLSFGVDNITLAGMQVPVYQVISMIIPYFVPESVSGIAQVWGGQVTLEIKNAGRSFMHRGSMSDLAQIVDQVSVDIIKTHSLDPDIASLRTESLVHFVDGSMFYRGYSETGNREFISKATKEYDAAVKIDGRFDLARLHLAILLFESREPVCTTESQLSFCGVTNAMAWLRRL